MADASGEQLHVACVSPDYALEIGALASFALVRLLTLLCDMSIAQSSSAMGCPSFYQAEGLYSTSSLGLSRCTRLF